MMGLCILQDLDNDPFTPVDRTALSQPMNRPSHLNRANADAFIDREVAESYRHRPSYPDDAIGFLSALAIDEPRRVLDLGCGTGFIARPLAPLVDRVDAVDASMAMIEAGMRQPGGDDRRINWIHERAEDITTDKSYSLIVAGESLHWMDWSIVLPRMATLISPRGMLAIARLDTLPLAWDDALRDIISKYSVVQDYKPFDMVAALEGAGLFEFTGKFESDPDTLEQSVQEYIESFHARSSLTRARMGIDGASAFDEALGELLRQHSGNRVVRSVIARVTYGRPLAGLPDQHA